MIFFFFNTKMWKFKAGVHDNIFIYRSLMFSIQILKSILSIFTLFLNALSIQASWFCQNQGLSSNLWQRLEFPWISCPILYNFLRLITFICTSLQCILSMVWRGKWVSRTVKEPYGVSLWRHICMGWSHFLLVLSFKQEIDSVFVFDMTLGVGMYHFVMLSLLFFSSLDTKKLC